MTARKKKRQMRNRERYRPNDKATVTYFLSLGPTSKSFLPLLIVPSNYESINPLIRSESS
jgi:hypothetical protein